MLLSRQIPITFVVVFLSGSHLVAQDNIQVVELTLHPPKRGIRSLAYPLLPTLAEQTDGNAVDWYKQASEELASQGNIDQSVHESFDDWMELPLDKFPLKDARSELKPYAKVIEYIEKGARCEYIDWGHREGLKKNGIGLLLPFIQDLRTFAQLLRWRAHVELAEGDIDSCLATLRLALGMCQHSEESPTLISSLVGIAMTMILVEEVQTVMAQPNVPSLYWSLTDLPNPMFDLRKAYQGERLSIYGTFPGMLDVMANKNAGPLPADKLKKMSGLLSSDFLGSGVGLSTIAERYKLALTIRAKHAVAKRALVAASRPKDKVEQMPHLQVAIIHAMMEYEELLDETIKYNRLPYYQVTVPLKELNNKFNTLRNRNDPTTPAIPLAPLLLPAIDTVMLARVRVDRRIAGLRCVEAIRLHVAEHGTFPKLLDDIEVVPVPLDPRTGKSFIYRKTKDGAILEYEPNTDKTKTLHFRYVLRAASSVEP